ncbi:MAG: hypothetical protein RIF41_27765 [Polyangiaceae bacterium]
MKKKQPPTNAVGANHTRICRSCDGLGRITRIIRAGLVEVVTCAKCGGKGGK